MATAWFKEPLYIHPGLNGFRRASRGPSIPQTPKPDLASSLLKIVVLINMCLAVTAITAGVYALTDYKTELDAVKTQMADMKLKMQGCENGKMSKHAKAKLEIVG